MSVAFLTAAFSARIGKSSTKSVLIALADRADDKTGLVFPSAADIVERTELNRKTVLNCLAELQEKKILNDTGKRTGRTNQVKIWRLDFSLIKELSQKRDSSNPSESVPITESFQKRNSSEFPSKASRFSAESIPKTGHGTTIEPSFNHHHEIDELVEAALWAARKGGGKINNEVGFRHKVRTRILSSQTGPSPEDVQSLLAWREAGKRAASQQASERPKDKNMNQNLNQHLDLDIDTCERGVRFLSAGLREKVKVLIFEPNLRQSLIRKSTRQNQSQSPAARIKDG